MRCADVRRLKNGDKLHAGSGFLYGRASTGFFALHQAGHSGDLESKITGGLDRLNRRGAGGANVVHNHNTSALLAESFDSLPGSVLFLLLTYKKAVNEKLSRVHWFWASRCARLNCL